MNGVVQNVVNGFGGLENINTRLIDLVAVPSTEGVFKANLPAGAPVSAAPLPSANVAGAGYTQKSSLTVYDNLGGSRVVDMYMTKTGVNTWEMTVYDQSTAASSSAPFPYSTGPLAVQSLSFSPSDGTLVSPSPLSFAVPNGATMNLDIAGMTQLGTGFIIADANVNGKRTVSGRKGRDQERRHALCWLWQWVIPGDLQDPACNRVSPNQLSAQSGTAYALSAESGGKRLDLLVKVAPADHLFRT